MKREAGFTLIEVLAAVVLSTVVLGAAIATLNFGMRSASQDALQVDGRASSRRMVGGIEAQLQGLSFLSASQISAGSASMTFIRPTTQVTIDGRSPGKVYLGTSDRAAIASLGDRPVLITGQGDALMVTLGDIQTDPARGTLTTSLAGACGQIPAGSSLYATRQVKLALDGRTLQQEVNGQKADIGYDVESFSMKAMYEGSAGSLTRQGAGLFNTIEQDGKQYHISALLVEIGKKGSEGPISYSASLPLSSSSSTAVKRYQACDATTPEAQRGGTLLVDVRGLPPAGSRTREMLQAVKYQVSGPSWNRNENDTRSEGDLRPGNYSITAQEIFDEEPLHPEVKRRWQVQNPSQQREVNAWTSAVVGLDYRTVLGGLDVSFRFFRRKDGKLEEWPGAPDSPNGASITNKIRVDLAGPLESQISDPAFKSILMASKQLNQLQLLPGSYSLVAPLLGNCNKTLYQGGLGCWYPQQISGVDLSGQPMASDRVDVSSEGTSGYQRALTQIAYIWQPPKDAKNCSWIGNAPVCQ